MNCINSPIAIANCLCIARILAFSTLIFICNTLVAQPYQDNDAGLVSVDSVSGYCSASQTIYITLENAGSNQMTSATIHWEWDGVLQSAVSWTGLLDSVTGTLPTEESIELGTKSFANSQHTIKVWISSVNGQTDPVSSNDTVSLTARSGLNGAYTIGGTTPDYGSISQAVDDLNLLGVCGPVTFNIRPGIYNEQTEITEVQYWDTPYRVTFQSEDTNTTSVTITHDATSIQDNYVFSLNGASNLTFRYLTLEATNYYRGRVIHAFDTTKYNTFEHCIFKGDGYGGTGHKTLVDIIGVQQHYNFTNNQFIGGYTAINSKGITLGGPSKGATITDNDFQGQVWYSIYFFYHSSPSVHNNAIRSVGGIYFLFCDSTITATNNHIITNSGESGITVNNSPAATGVRSLVANNFIRVHNSPNSFGLVVTSSNNVDVYNNTVYFTGPSDHNNYGSTLLLTNGTGNKMKNNLLVNTRDGDVLRLTGGLSLVENDYNNYYSTGPALMRYGSLFLEDIPAIQDILGGNANSLDLNPLIWDLDEPYTEQIGLVGAGTPLAEVIDDIDGDLRDVLAPDIGADEFIPSLDYDAGISEIISPSRPFTSGNHDVKATLRNLSNQTLSSVTVDWTVNGSSQSTFNWTGSIASGGIDTITIGSYTFNAGTTYEIESWTTLPNGQPDELVANDSAFVDDLYTSLSGVYTIGGTNPDFANFNLAVTALNQLGVAGSVTFNVRNGTYTEQISLNEIVGTSANNNVIFQSESGNRDSVVLTYASSRSDSNYTLQLNGADHILFRQMTLEATGADYAHSIYITGPSLENVFDDNVVRGPQTTSIDVTRSVIRIISNDKVDDNIFSNNLIQQGSYGIGVYGPSPSITNSGIVIKDNILEDQYYRSIYMLNCDAAEIRGNEISTTSAYNLYEGVHMDRVHGPSVISENKINGNLGRYGIHIDDCDATSGGRLLVANNFVKMEEVSTNGTKCLNIISSSFIDVLYNTLDIGGTATTFSYALSARSNGDITILNNIVSNSGGGRVIDLSFNYGQVQSDYNNLHTTLNGGGVVAQFNNAIYDSLSDFQTASGMEANSISDAPQFVASDDLHLAVGLSNASAIPIGSITTDIDGELRDTLTPDIGADEFFGNTGDVGIAAIIAPTSGCTLNSAEAITVRIHNYGNIPQTGFDVTYEFNSQSPITENIGALSIAAGSYIDFTFTTTVDMNTLGNYRVLAYTSLGGDNDLLNDTLLDSSIDRYTPFEITLTNDTANCIGEGVNITATGAQNYLWSTGEQTSTILADPAVFTTYSVSVTDSNGCEVTGAVTVTPQGHIPTLTFSGTPGAGNSFAEPDTGLSVHHFTFKAMYTDAEGELPAPGFPLLQLDFEGNGDLTDPDDLNIVMTEVDDQDLNVVDGKEYIFSQTGLGASSDWLTQISATDVSGCPTVSSTVAEPVVYETPDLFVFANDITFSDPNPDAGESLTIGVNVHNDFGASVQNVKVSLYEEDSLVREQIIPLMQSGEVVNVNWPYSFPVDQFYPMKVVIDKDNTIEETNELNNFAIRPVVVGNYQINGGIEVDVSLPADTMDINDPILFKLTANYVGVFGTDFEVAGAEIRVSQNGASPQLWGYTRSDGNYERFLSLGIGMHVFEGTVTDFTLSANFGPDTIWVVSGPDLGCEITANSSYILVGDTLRGELVAFNSGYQDVTNDFVLAGLKSPGVLFAWDTVFGGLAIGESYSIPYAQSFDMVGILDIRSSVDHEGVIPETDFEPNICILQIPVLPDMPDLIPDTSSESTREFITGVPDFIKFKVENFGGAPSGPFHLKVFDDDGNGAPDLIYSDTIDNLEILEKDYPQFTHAFNTSGVHYLILKVDEPIITNGVVDEYRENNNVVIDTVVVYSPTPDFEFIDQYVQPSIPTPGNQLDLVTALANKGYFTVPQGDSILVYYTLKIGPGAPVTIPHYYTGGFNGRGFVHLSETITTPPFGNDSVFLEVDPFIEYAEIREDNNKAQLALCRDFRISPIEGQTFSGFQDRVAEVGEPVFFDIWLVNRGDYAATDVVTRFYVEGVYIGNDTMSISARDSVIIGRSISNVFNAPGTYSVRIEADIFDDWVECNEWDNVWQGHVTIIEPPTDLQILSYMIAPTELNPDSAEQVNIFLSYENIGSEKTDSLLVRCLVDGLQLGNNILVPGLDPNEKATILVPTPYSSNDIGVHIIRGIVDADDRVPEFNETNNEATRAIIVGDAPNLHFTSFEVSYYEPVLNDVIDIIAEVGNNGHHSCSARMEYFYINDLSDTILIASDSIYVNELDTVVFIKPWTVTDEITTIYCRFTNPSPQEFDELDNEVSLEIGPSPGAVSQMLPADSSIDMVLPVMFSWAPASHATSYDLYLWPATAAQPSSPTISEIKQIFHLQTSALNSGISYKWQIVANYGMHHIPSNIQSFTMKGVPDLAVDTVIVPPTAFSGQQITVDWITINQGMGNTGSQPWFDVLFLSQDTIFNPLADTRMAAVPNLTALQVAEGYSNSREITLPNGIDGDYYLIAVANYFEDIEEPDSLNNILSSSAPISVSLTPPTDLQVTNVLAPANTFSGSPANITWTVKNEGQSITDDSIWYDRLYLSTSPFFDSTSATDLGSFVHTGLLAPDSSYVRSGTVVLPQAIDGTYYVYVTTDILNNVYEHAFNTNNTGRSDSVNIILRPPPDLLISSFNYPDTTNSGDSILLEWSVKNQGDTIHMGNSWSDLIVLSTDSTYALDSTNVHAIHFDPQNRLLPTDSSYSSSTMLAIPEAFGGRLFAYVIADFKNQIYEFTAENNNAIVSPAIEVLNPDLSVSSISHPLSADAGSSVQVEWYIKNNGPGTINSKDWEDVMFIATTQQPNPSFDPVVATHQHQDQILPSGDSVLVQATFNIPIDIQGPHYLYVITDQMNQVYENQQENNNLSFSASTIDVTLPPWPDLEMLTIQVDDTAQVGDIVTLSYTVRNNGIAATPPGGWVDYIMISTVDSFREDQVEILEELLITDVVGVGSSYMRQVSVQLPFDADAGEHYFYVYADADDELFENGLKENNLGQSNPLYIEELPPADLAITAFSAPDSAETGDRITISWTVENVGSFPIGNIQWGDIALLSQDTMPEETDILLPDMLKSGPLLVGESYTQQLSFDIPIGLSGDYYLMVFTDYMEYTGDTNFMNNFNVPHILNITLTPPPDLIVQTFTAPALVTPGQPITAEWRVKNIGTGPTVSGAWTERFYLSNNLSLDSTDLQLGAYVRTGNLQVGTSYADTLDMIIPQIAEGNYNILMWVDATDLEFEGQGAGNNIAATSITVVQPPPGDLEVTNIQTPSTAQAGDVITVDWNLENNGPYTTNGVVNDLVYLSTDQQWDINDVLLGGLSEPVLIPPSGSIVRSLSKPLTGVDLGSHYVIVRTDVLNQINETNEQNNETTSFSTVSIDVPELQLDVLTADTLVNQLPVYYRIEIPSGLAGESVLVTLNSAASQASNEVYIRYQQIPTRSQHDLSARAPMLGNQQLVIPDVMPGTYYVMIYGINLADTLQTADILAEVLEFSILSVNADEGGNTGNVTVEVNGGKLEDLVGLFLEKDGVYILADTIYHVDPSKVYATFNLSGAALGTYNVIGFEFFGTRDTLNSGFEVVTGLSPELSVRVVHPASSRPVGIVKLTIEYANVGNIDATNAQAELISLRGAPLALSVQDLFQHQTELLIEIENDDSPAGIIRPGAIGSIAAYARAISPLIFSLTIVK